MRDDLRPDVTALQREVHRLAVENAELRAMLALDAAAPPGFGTGSALDLRDPEALDHRYGAAFDSGHASPIDLRTGLPRELLRRRRFKGRLIAGALVLLGLGVGAGMVMASRTLHFIAPSPAIEMPELPPVPPPPPMPEIPPVPPVR